MTYLANTGESQFYHIFIPGGSRRPSVNKIFAWGIEIVIRRDAVEQISMVFFYLAEDDLYSFFEGQEITFFWRIKPALPAKDFALAKN